MKRTTQKNHLTNGGESSGARLRRFSPHCRPRPLPREIKLPILSGTDRVSSSPPFVPADVHGTDPKGRLRL